MTPAEIPAHACPPTGSTQLARTIAGQAAVVERLLSADLGEAVHGLEQARRIWLVGTGTSQHAAELGAQMLASTGVETHWRSAATFARWGPPLGEEDAVVVISHTGETSFARRARCQALHAGAKVSSITAEGVGWPEAIETMPRETSETYSASYTAALVVLARLAVALGSTEFCEAQLGTIPDRIRAAAAETPAHVPVPQRLLVLVGAGPAAITAREGALKLREAARLAAEGYEAEYLLHGSAVPLAAGDTLLLMQPQDDPDGLVERIGTAALDSGLAVARIEEPEGLPPVLAQVPLTVRLQALSSHLAEAGGHDPDNVIVAAWASDALWKSGAPDSD